MIRKAFVAMWIVQIAVSSPAWGDVSWADLTWKPTQLTCSMHLTEASASLTSVPRVTMEQIAASSYGRFAYDMDNAKSVSNIVNVVDRSLPPVGEVRTVSVGAEMVVSRTQIEREFLRSDVAFKLISPIGNMPLPKQASPLRMGIELSPANRLDKGKIRRYRLTGSETAVVVNVRRKTVAKRSRVRLGDVIVRVDGKDILDPQNVRDTLPELAGRKVPLEVLRKGRRKILTLDFTDYGRSVQRAPYDFAMYYGACLDNYWHEEATLEALAFTEHYVEAYIPYVLARQEPYCKNPPNYCGTANIFVPDGLWEPYRVGKYGSFYGLPLDSTIDQLSARPTNSQFEFTRFDWDIYVPNTTTGGDVMFVRFNWQLSALLIPIRNAVLPKLQRIIKARINADDLQQTLYYNGLSGDTLRFSYREFKGDMARDAYTQQVTYDLKLGEVVGFKKARFEIIAADNLTITYKLLAHFK